MTTLLTPEPGQPNPRSDVPKIEYGTLSLVCAIFPWLIAIYFWWLSRATESSLAVVLSLFFCFFGPFMAVLFGHQGLRKSQVRREVAMSGLFLGYAQIALLLIAFVSLLFLMFAFSGI